MSNGVIGVLAVLAVFCVAMVYHWYQLKTGKTEEPKA